MQVMNLFNVLATNSISEKIKDFFTNLLSNDFIAFVSIIVLIGIFLVVSIVIFAVEEHKNRRFKTLLMDPDRFIKVLTISAPRGEVSYFALNDISHKVTLSLNDFYQTFSLSERKRLSEWIESIISNNAEVPYFQSVSYRKKGKEVIRSFYRLVSYETTSGTLHLESYYVNSSFNARSKKKIASTESEFAQALKANGSASGMTFCFKLIEKNASRLSPETKSLPNDLTRAFVDYVSRYAIGNMKVIPLSPGEVLIANFSFVDLSHALLFSFQAISGVNDMIKSFCKKTKKSNRYEIRCGIVKNRDLLGDSDRIIKEASLAATLASESHHSISIYEKKAQSVYVPVTEEINENQVDKIIAEKRISYTFRPIYDTKKMRILGFISRAAPIGTSFGSMDELKNYAIRTNSLKTLFTAIARYTIPRFNSERSNKEHKLFFPVRMDERDIFVPFFQRYRSVKETNLYLTFGAADVANTLNKPGIEEFLRQMASLREKGIKMAIVLNENVLNLDKSIYEASDAFLVDLGNDENLEIDTKIRSELHAVVEGLIKYRKPTIVINLPDWNAIEIVVRSDITYISSDAFAPYEKMMKPVISKNVQRIKAMKEGK